LRRGIHKLVFLLVLFLSPLLTAASLPKDLEIPPGTNVFLIVVDTLRADHLGCYGYSRNTSPHLDALAKESILFKNATAQSTWTKPSVTSMLTGLYPKNHHMNGLKSKLGTHIRLLPQILHENQYTTYSFASNLFVGKTFGLNRGYDHFFAFPETNKRKGRYANSSEVNERLISVVRTLPQKSYNFFYIHYMDPHAPYVPRQRHFSIKNQHVIPGQIKNGADWRRLMGRLSPEIRKQETTNLYDDEIVSVDQKIGEFLELLKGKGLYENSIIIVTADHGESFGEHGHHFHRKTLYEGEIQVPLLIKLPEGVSITVEEQVSHVDILPSILDLLGISISHPVDGVSFFQEARGDMSAISHTELRSRRLGGVKSYSLRTPKAKLILHDLSKRKFVVADKRVEFVFGEKELEVNIVSIKRPRKIRILVDGEAVREVMIYPKMQSIKTSFPGVKERKIVIETESVCDEIPGHAWMEKPWCVSFQIFNSSNFNLKDMKGIKPLVEKEYYRLDKDPQERNNLYREGNEDPLQNVMEKELTAYIADIPASDPGDPSEKLDRKQMELLRSLGYLQ